MEFTLEEITDLLNGPLNDEDLYAICEKMCLAVLDLDHNQCRKIMITRDSVFLGPEGNIKIEIDLHRQKITKENLMANHIYAIGTVLLWLAKSKSPNRDRDQMLENLMSEMMNTSPTDRPTMEIVSQACEMILQRYQVSSKDILNVMYDDCVQNPGVAALVEKRKRRRLKGPLIKPRTKSPYQLVSIEDRGGELKDGSLIEEQLEHEADGREIAEAEQARLDPDESVSSHDTHDILDETDLDSNPPTEGTWDYDHMDVSVTAETEEETSQKTQEKLHETDPMITLTKQTSEDREVANFTGKHSVLLSAPQILSDSTSESGESIGKCPAEEDEDYLPSNRFRSLSNDQLSNEGVTELNAAPVAPVAVSPVPVKPITDPTDQPCEEVIESKVEEDTDNEKDEKDSTLAATFIKKPSKPKPKASDLWRKAGMNIKSKLNLPSNKGLLGVVKQAEAQGQIKPKLFNRNITKAISAMAKKQAEKDQVKIEKPNHQDKDGIPKEVVNEKKTDSTKETEKQSQDDKPVFKQKPENNEEKDQYGEIEKSKATNPQKGLPELFPKPEKGKAQPFSKNDDSRNLKSKSSKPDKPKTNKKVPVTRPRSASVTTKPSNNSAATKSNETKPRRQSVAVTTGAVKDQKPLSKASEPPKPSVKPPTKPKAGSTKIQKTITPKDKPPLKKSAVVSGNKTPIVQRKTSAPSPSVTRKSSSASPAVKRKSSAPSPSTQRKNSTSKTPSAVSKPPSKPAANLSNYVSKPPLQRKASLTKSMAKPTMKTIPENKLSAATKRRASLPAPPPTTTPKTPATRRKSVGSVERKSGTGDKKPAAAKKPVKKDSQEKLTDEYEPVMVPRKDLVVDKDDPGCKRSERILSIGIGSPKQETPNVSPEPQDETDTIDKEPIKETEIDCLTNDLKSNVSTPDIKVEGDKVDQTEEKILPEELHLDPFVTSPADGSEITETPTQTEPVAFPEPPDENPSAICPDLQFPKRELDKTSDDEQLQDQPVIQKPIPQKKGIADLNNLDSSFEIAVQLDPPDCEDIFPEADPEDSIELEFTSPDISASDTPPILTTSLETSVEIAGGLETILETSRENETADTSTDLDLEPQKEVLSEVEEMAEKARQEQMKRLLEEPEIEPVDLPEVSVKETGKQNRSPSSKYKRMKSTSTGRKPVVTNQVKSEHTFTFQPVQLDKSELRDDAYEETPDPLYIIQPEPEEKKVDIPDIEQMKNQVEDRDPEEVEEGEVSTTPPKIDLVNVPNRQPEPSSHSVETSDEDHMSDRDTPVNTRVEKISPEHSEVEKNLEIENDAPPETAEIPDMTKPDLQTNEDILEQKPVSVQTNRHDEDDVMPTLIEPNRAGEQLEQERTDDTMDQEKSFNFKPISPAVNQSEENEDSFYPKLKVQPNPEYRSPSPVAIMRDLVKPLNFSTETVNLEELMKVLDRPLGENELWLFLLGTAKSLMSTTGIPALNPTMISIDSNGIVRISETDKQKLPMSETEIIHTEKAAVFSVGACLWYCADYGLSESEEPALSKALQNLLVDMTQSVVEDRPSLDQLIQEYKKHMGQEEKTLRSLYSQYRSQLRNSSGSVLPLHQYPAPTPSIQIIINKDDMANRSLRLDPSITINERTADDLSRSRVVQLPLRDRRDNTAQRQTPYPGQEPVSFTSRALMASTPNPGLIKRPEEDLDEKQFVDFLSVEDPEVSPPVQMMKSSAQRNRAGNRYSHLKKTEPPKYNPTNFNIPDIKFTDATSSFSKEDDCSRSEPKTKVDNFFKPSDYVHIPEQRQEDRMGKETSDGEFEPDNQAFLDLEEGMSSLRSQVSRLLEQDNSHIFSTPPRIRTISHDVCSTPMTSSPLNSTIDDLEDYSISPIKEQTFDDMSNILDRAAIERPVQKQLVRRASIAETLTQFQSEGRIPPESSGALQDIMSLLDLEVDINDVLEYLEKRIEVNIDRLEQGDTVVNALAGIESDIEFKLLQVEAMRKATKRDDDELTKIRGNSGSSSIEPEVRVSDLSGSKESEGIEEELMAHLAPSGRVSFGTEGGVQGLNVQILEHLREISKSPLHFEDEEDGRDARTPVDEKELGTGYNLMQNIINKHAPLLSPRSTAVTANIYSLPSRSTKEYNEDSKPTIGMLAERPNSKTKSQKVSIPKDQLMMFFQRHLPEQDSREVMESLGANILDISDEDEPEPSRISSRVGHKTGTELFEEKILPVIDETEEVSIKNSSHRENYRNLGRKQLVSMCSVEERLDLSEDDTSDNEGSVTTRLLKPAEISSAYGRTSPDGAYSERETDTNYPTFDIGPVVLKPREQKIQEFRDMKNREASTKISNPLHTGQVEVPAPPQYFDKTAESLPFLSSYQLPSLM